MGSLLSAMSRDLRRVGRSITLIGLFSFLLALPVTYQAIFAFEVVGSIPNDGDSTESDRSYVRVADPLRSVVSDMTDRSLYAPNTPGLRYLLGQIGKQSDMVIVERVDQIEPSELVSEILDQDGIVVIGSHPQLSTLELIPGMINVWPGGGADIESISQSYIGPVPVVINEADAPRFSYYHNGWLRNSDSRTIYLMDGDTAGILLESTSEYPEDMLQRFTCYCTSSALDGVIEGMNVAERESGTGRFYTPADSEEFIGLESLDEISRSVWTVIFSAAVVCSYIGFFIAKAHDLWTRQRGAMRVERLYGAAELSLHLRFHAQVLFVFTLPALTAYHLVNTVVGASSFPPPIPSDATYIVISMVLVAHLYAALGATTDIRRMCSFSSGVLK